MTIDLGLSAASAAAAAASSSSGGPGRRGVGGVPPSPCTTLPPGFRFHPTDEELILHYLRKRAAAAPCPAPVIAEVDIYKFDPWQLPAKAVFGEAEWYFFSPRDRKYPNGVRPNRAAGSGYWKATGTDKPITLSSSSGSESNGSSRGAAMIGVKKALVFYKGRPPKGMKTSWIMHEYRLAEALNAVNTYRPVRFIKNASMRLDDYVLCRIYKKTTPQLAYSMSRPHEEASSMDAGGSGGGAGFDLGLHLVDDSSVSAAADNDIMAAGTSYASRLPRPASISDYLVDYSAVSELFDTLPPPPPETTQTGVDATTRFYFGNSSEPAAASTSVLQQQQQQQSPLKRRSMDEDYSSSGGMNASSSKRVMMSDHHAAAAAASMAASNAFSLFEPGQTSLQDRI